MAKTLTSRQLLMMAHSCPKHVEQLIKEKIKHYTKVTSSWFVIHTELRCTVNHISDKFFYFNFFSASFCTAFLSAGIATSISVHVLSFLFLIIISGLFAVTYLSAYYYYYYHHYHHHRRRRPLSLLHRPERGFDHTTQSSGEVKERVELHFCTEA